MDTTERAIVALERIATDLERLIDVEDEILAEWRKRNHVTEAEAEAAEHHRAAGEVLRELVERHVREQAKL